MNKIKWKNTWNERKTQILHELYRINFSVWEDALIRCGGWNMDSAGYIIDNYIRFNGVLNGYSSKRDSLRSMIIKHFVEVRISSKQRSFPPKLSTGKLSNHTFWQAKFKDELLRVSRVNKNIWKYYSQKCRCRDETDTAISIIKNVTVLNGIFTTLSGDKRQTAIEMLIGFFTIQPNMRLPEYVVKIKDDMIWEKKVRDINDALVEMHNGDKGIWDRYSYGKVLYKDSAIKIISDYTKLDSLTDGLGGDKRKKIVKMVIEFFTDETRETKMEGLTNDEWERRKFDIGLAVELIDSGRWDDALVEAGMERSAAAELLMEDDSELSALTDHLSTWQRDEAESIIVYHFTEDIKYCTWERRKKEVKKSLRKLVNESSCIWKEALTDNYDDMTEAASDVIEDNDSINSLTDNLTNDQWGELEKLVIDYFTVHHIAEPKHKVGDEVCNKLSDHLRVDLVRVLESNDSLFTAAWNMGMDHNDAPYEVASKILIKYSSTSYIYSKILDEGEVSEAIDFIIDYYTKGKGEEMHTGVFSDHLRVDLVRILEKHNRFNDAWKEGIERGDTPYDVASRILATYTETDGICTKIIIQREVREAKYFIIDYYTRGKGEEMPKKKVKLLKEDAKELKKILSSDDFDEIWKKKIKEGNDPEVVANIILTGYNSTDSFFTHLDNIHRPAAVVFVINYFTKGEGVMGKIKDAVQDTKDETIKAGAIALKITSGNIAIKNIKKIMVSTFGMKDDAKKKFMESAIADVGIAQVGSFLMSLPQNDGKMTDTLKLKLVRECIILASTQKAFESLDVDKYVDKMLDGIDLPALKELAKKDSVADK